MFLLLTNLHTCRNYVKVVRPSQEVWLADDYPGTLATGRLTSGLVVTIEDIPFTEWNLTSKTIIVKFKKGDQWHRLQVLLSDVCATKPPKWNRGKPDWGKNLTLSTIVSLVDSYPETADICSVSSCHSFFYVSGSRTPQSRSSTSSGAFVYHGPSN